MGKGANKYITRFPPLKVFCMPLYPPYTPFLGTQLQWPLPSVGEGGEQEVTKGKTTTIVTHALGGAVTQLFLFQVI